MEKTVDELLEKNLHFGYMEGYSAYSITCFSDGKIEVAPYTKVFGNRRVTSCLDSWYENPDKEEYFILLESNETIDERVYQEAKEIEYIQGFECLIFDSDPWMILEEKQ